MFIKKITANNWAENRISDIFHNGEDYVLMMQGNSYKNYFSICRLTDGKILANGHPDIHSQSSSRILHDRKIWYFYGHSPAKAYNFAITHKGQIIIEDITVVALLGISGGYEERVMDRLGVAAYSEEYVVFLNKVRSENWNYFSDMYHMFTGIKIGGLSSYGDDVLVLNRKTIQVVLNIKSPIEYVAHAAIAPDQQTMAICNSNAVCVLDL